MRKAVHALSSTMGAVAGILVILAIFPTVLDVASRYVTGRSLRGVVEYSEVILIVIVYFAMGAAFRNGSHISTPIFLNLLPPGLARALDFIGCAILAIVLATAIYLTALLAINSYAIGEFRFGLTQVPIWPAKIAIPIGLAVMFLEVVLRALDLMTGRADVSTGETN